jgi:hypothetical protein
MATRLDAVGVIKVVSTGVPYGVTHLGKADSSESCSHPACCIAVVFLLASLVARRERAVRLLLLQRITRLLLDATRRTHVLAGPPLVEVMLPRRIQNRGARVKTSFADTDVLGVLFHLLDIFVILPPVDKLGDRVSVLMLLSHAACRI